MTVEGKISGPLLRAPLSSDAASLSEREIRASEITSFLRIALKSVCDEERLKRISSHSLKRTPLAWCAKFGVSEPVRSVLGRHVSTTAGSQAIYAVDLATSAVKEFEQVLGRVSTGSFNPDNPRAEYFVSTVPTLPSTSQADEIKVEAEASAIPAPRSTLIVVGSDSESSSASSSSSTGSSSEDEAPPAKVARSEWPWPLSKALMHAKSKKCHYVMARSGGGNAILACGKVGSGNYVAPASFDQVSGACQNCRRVVAGLERLSVQGDLCKGTRKRIRRPRMQFLVSTFGASALSLVSRMCFLQLSHMSASTVCHAVCSGSDGTQSHSCLEVCFSPEKQQHVKPSCI